MLVVVKIKNTNSGSRLPTQYLLLVSVVPWTTLAQRMRFIAFHQVHRADPFACSFTHYLREEDKDNALNMLGMVAANNDPTNAPYSFSVRCAADDDTDCKAAKGGRAQR